ncbi:MAG TPA: hypothetical protein VMZ28_13400 [Kofleriaceae bacterium]|nr:hypothetical protein [Kofleriaceae bacterium]
MIAPRLLLSIALGLSLAGCGGDDDGENVGSACEVADDCFDDIERESIVGDIECLDRVEGGYCTHLCESDDDCCAVDGECETDLPQVCAPFENSDQKRCFLSCETDVIGDEEETAFCQDHAHESFLCRSTGGGGENRKVCVPEG